MEYIHFARKANLLAFLLFGESCRFWGGLFGEPILRVDCRNELSLGSTLTLSGAIGIHRCIRHRQVELGMIP